MKLRILLVAIFTALFTSAKAQEGGRDRPAADRPDRVVREVPEPYANTHLFIINRADKTLTFRLQGAGIANNYTLTQGQRKDYSTTDTLNFKMVTGNLFVQYRLSARRYYELFYNEALHVYDLKQIAD